MKTSMTESQQLIKEHARHDSEAAFRELVGRYVNLVYATALRIVGKDAHLAEDVSQTVFITLARKLKSLPPEVMLGGWLHRCTFNVATKAVRREQRRQVTERHAAELMAMNTSQDSEETARRIRPMLDNALMQLGRMEHQAILLRFFEEKDFHAIGTALHLSEDAARMRVNRALKKLHAILTKRGVTLTVGGIAAVLAAETAATAPLGLAPKLAGGALAAGSGGILHSALVAFTNTTKWKASVAGVIVLTGIVASVVVHRDAVAKLQEMDAALANQAVQRGKLLGENSRLTALLAEQVAAKKDLADLERLRVACSNLRQKTNQLAALREESRALREKIWAPSRTPLTKSEDVGKRMNFAMFMAGVGEYYAKETGHFPKSLDETHSFFPCPPEIDPNEFEYVYHGPPLESVTNAQDTIVVRENNPWAAAEGKWCKAYGFADGHAETVAMPITWNSTIYNDFYLYEQARGISKSTP